MRQGSASPGGLDRAVMASWYPQGVDIDLCLLVCNPQSLNSLYVCVLLV